MDQSLKTLVSELQTCMAELRAKISQLDDSLDREMAIDDVARVHLAFGDFIMSLPEFKDMREEADQ